MKAMSSHELARALMERPEMTLQAFAVIEGQGLRFDIVGGASSEKYRDADRVVIMDLVKAEPA